MNILQNAKRTLFFTVILLCGLLFSNSSHAAPGVRANVTYQARLMDASGYPVVDGVYQVEFSLYDAAVAGNRLWSASGTTAVPLPVNVTVQDGLFTVLLGDGVTQLPFTDIDWNSDSLYLGVTIGADGEMSPRRPITAVPQAINSAQLGGMSPSSTDTYGGESQFTITQASTTAATSTRSALDVRSYGASAANDFAFRALTNAGTPAFTITSQGVVSSTNLIVAGQNVCLADGTDCLPGGIESDTLLSVTNRGSVATATLTLLGGAISNTLNVTDTATIANAVVTSTLTVSGTISSNLLPTTDLTYSLGTPSLRWNGSFGDVTIVNGTTTNATSTNFFAANAAFGSLIANSGNITELLATNATFTSVTSTNGFFSSLVGSTFAAGSATVGTSTIGFVNVTGSLFAPSGTITDLNGSGLVFSNATFTNATATTLFASLVSSSQIFVGGQSVCLANGTNCLADGSLQSAYNAGKSITLNSGHIELTSVTGTSSDFLTEDFGATATRMIGGGIAGVTTTGFDIIGYDTGNGRGVELTFSSDRDGVNAPAGQSYLYGASTARISYLTDKFDNPSLLLSTNTSTITVGNDYLYFSIVDNGSSAANMSMDVDGLFNFQAQVGGGVEDVAPYSFSNGVDIGAMVRLQSSLAISSIWLIDDQDPNTLGYTPSAISDLMFRSNSTAGPGSQLYVNTDGTDTGWTGIATVDMLSSLTLQDVYNAGTSISTGFGPVVLNASTTGPDLFPAFPWLDSYRTLVSKGFDDDGIAFNHGSGTWDNQHYIEFFNDVSLPPITSVSSSYIMGDTMAGTLDLVGGRGVNIGLGNATTTFNTNIIVAPGKGVASNFSPFLSDTYSIGDASKRWDRGFFNAVSSTLLDLVSGSIAIGNYGASSTPILSASHNQGGIDGFDILMLNDVGVTGTALFTTADRSKGIPFQNNGLTKTTSTALYSYYTNVSSTFILLNKANDNASMINMTDSNIDISAAVGTSTNGLITMRGESIGPAVRVSNNSSSFDQSWDLFARRLLVGESVSATGTADYNMVLGYMTAGLCLDDLNTTETCPTGVAGSIFADGTITSDAFDIAEMYNVSGTASAGDLVKITKTATATVEITNGIEYDNDTIGVISTKPGFVLGWTGDVQVALAGRVPTKVSVGNGVIAAGDRLTASPIPGVAMKATRPGQIIGIALEDANVSGVIEVFLQPGFDMSSAFAPDGSMTLVNEYGSTTFSVSAEGDAFFLGGVSATSFTTHAAFDLAERYSSPDKLEPGDLVMINAKADMQMVRTMDESSTAVGIISTAPGFTLGAATEGTFPVALAGRVPTKVSTMNGAIASGDAIKVSSIPGVGVKATDEGMIVGYALESFEKGDIGMIEVFVQPGYWMPSQTNTKNLVDNVATQTGAQHQGFAFIEMEGTSVHVAFPSILAYPVPQVTALTHVKGDWWLDNITDEGFDIVLETKQDLDIRFAWQVNPAQVGMLQYHSDGTYGEIDPLTGKLIVIEEDPVDDLVVEPDQEAVIDPVEELIEPEVVAEEVVE